MEIMLPLFESWLWYLPVISIKNKKAKNLKLIFVVIYKKITGALCAIFNQNKIFDQSTNANCFSALTEFSSE